MPSVWLMADPHFGHQGVCKFMRRDGVTKLRPWDNADEMDADMIQRWNDTVKATDKVYMLGDIVINRKALPILHKLHGDKVLIKGNHDIFKLDDYTKYFRDIRAYHVMNGLILSHVPVHPMNLYRFGCNIHGHLHDGRVMKMRGVNVKTDEILYGTEIDPRYFCVSAEHIDYTPILFEEVLKRIKEQGGIVGFKSGNGPT